MENNKVKKPVTAAISRDLSELEEVTGNIYQTIAIMSKRANQISSNMKEELQGKLEEFASDHDNLEEIFENREQIEISSHYERLPKPTLKAIEEMLNDKIYYRSTEEESAEE
jgi:DNA-directed RNA polymerase subunit K/omega